jgi:hypothetical protein
MLSRVGVRLGAISGVPPTNPLLMGALNLFHTCERLVVLIGIPSPVPVFYLHYPICAGSNQTARRPRTTLSTRHGFARAA